MRAFEDVIIMSKAIGFRVIDWIVQRASVARIRVQDFDIIFTYLNNERVFILQI